MKPRWFRKATYRRVIDRLWTCCGRVTYEEFSEALQWSRAHMLPERRETIVPLSAQAFSYHLQLYLAERGIRRRRYSWIRRHLLQAIQEGRIDPSLRERDLLEAAGKLLVDSRTVLPSETKLRRLLRSARAQAAGRQREGRLVALEGALGIVLKDLPLVQRFKAASELLRYPPSWRGKANLQTMSREGKVMQELGEVIRTNRLPVEKMVASPELEMKKGLVERLFPSQVSRRERRAIVEALPFYVIGRWRDARDTVLACFVRKARLLQFNLKALENEEVRDASVAFMERSTPRFRTLHRAVLKSLETGKVEPLRHHRTFLAEIEREGMRLAEQEVYYRLLSGRGGYVRKMAHRLVPVTFEGHDSRARAITEAMKEVYRFSPFRVPVPASVVESLGFLDVPPAQLRRRKAFETVVVMTLADLLWGGRVTVPGSRTYRNKWNDIPPLEESSPIQEPGQWVTSLRRRLEAAGALFRERARETKLVKEGRLSVPRVRRATQDDDEDEPEPESQPQVHLPSIGIVDLLWQVHEATGFLDTFRLPGPAARRLGEEERKRLGIAVLLGMGLNLGLRETSRSRGRGFPLWKLRNFAANYFTAANLREALDRVAVTWDSLRLGKHWGTGSTCSVDGRAVYSYASNLISRYHHRKGRIGVTIYWMVRDDHLAASVRIIGNQEWESWYILNDLIRKVGGKSLEVSTGDTHGQHLSAFGLAELLGKRMTVRFRQLGQVKIYGPARGRWCRLDRVGAIDWGLLRRAAHSLRRIATAVERGAILSSDILRTWNIYDENGVNVAEALRELGRVVRTEFILSYAADPSLREQIQRGCQRAENWNSFQAAVFFGKGGRIETNNPTRRDEIGLAMALLQDCIVFHNAWKHGHRLRKVTSATPVVWHHVMLLGRYKITKRRPPSRNEA